MGIRESNQAIRTQNCRPRNGFRKTFGRLERQAVDKAMRLSEGNITRAAEYLGITRFALYRKLEKLGL